AKLIEEYLDSRIEYYEASGEAARARIESSTKGIERRIWDTSIEVTRTDRGAIENTNTLQLDTMFDLTSSRNIALSKTLPWLIYLVILVISSAGLATLNFSRGMRRELGQWQPGILIAMVSFVFCLVLDLDRPTTGLIQITQDAMVELRQSWKSDTSRNWAG